MQTLLRDLRYALRQIIRNPGFSIHCAYLYPSLDEKHDQSPEEPALSEVEVERHSYSDQTASEFPSGSMK